MFRTLMKSTSALALGLTAAAPPLPAQEAEIPPCDVAELGAMAEIGNLVDPTAAAEGEGLEGLLPCEGPDGEVIETVGELVESGLLDAAADEDGTEGVTDIEEDTTAETDAPEAPLEVEEGDLPAADLDVEAPELGDEAAEPPAGPLAGEEPPVPAETEEAIEDIADVPTDEERTDATEADAETEAGVQAEAEAEAEGMQPEPEVDAAADAEAEAEAEAEPEVDTAEEAEAEAEPEADAAAEAEAEPEADAAVEAEAEPEPEADAEAEPQPEADAAEEAQAEAEAPADVDVAAEIEADVPTGAEAEAEVEAPDALAAEAAEALDEDAEGAEAEAALDAEVTVEEVTEETARRAAEEFETEIEVVEGEAPAEGADEDEGLTSLERALLLGLGAVTVGSLLQGGGEVVANTGDRIIVERDGELQVLRDENVLLRQPGAEVRTETYADGSTRTVVTRDDGTRVVTIRAADGQVLRRTRILPDGTRVVLFDDTRRAAPVDVAELPQPAETPVIDVTRADEAALREALMATQYREFERNFSLRQIREIREVRELAPKVELDAITFPTGSAAIQPNQAEELAELGRTLAAIIDERPGAVFLVEGHTDAVGSAAYNLALSDRRAETVALALTEYYDVPPENLVTQGYGESALKVPTAGPERENRRAVVRNITPLLS